MSLASQAPSIAVDLSGSLAGNGDKSRSSAAEVKSTLQRVSSLIWNYLQQGSAIPMLKRRQRRLRVSETLPLGDKRFVSILEVDGQSFLVGSTGANITLLASLAPEQALPFEQVLGSSLQRGNVR